MTKPVNGDTIKTWKIKKEGWGTHNSSAEKELESWTAGRNLELSDEVNVSVQHAELDYASHDHQKLEGQQLYQGLEEQLLY